MTLSVTLVAALGLASSSHAKNQQYQGSLVIESFGNDLLTGEPNTGYFEAFGMPQGLNCNKYQPRCPFTSTPIETLMGGTKVFHPNPACATVPPKGKVCPVNVFNCTPYTYFGPMRATKAAMTVNGKFPLGPPFYRNPGFFTPGGARDLVSCTATSTVGGGMATVFLTTNSPLRGKVMKGKPLTGENIVKLTGTNPAGFYVKAAPLTPVKTPGPTGFGLRRTTQGEFNNIFPYVYSYTYATLRNDKGTFFAGGGPGSFDIQYTNANKIEGRVKVTAGPNQFGGVQRLLGQLTTKVCYYQVNGCLLGGNSWNYEDIGAMAYYDANGVVSAGYIATHKAYYYHTAGMMNTVVPISGARFPWTTGTVYALAKYRGPVHDTVVERKGFDNRTTMYESGMRTIQLVTPVLTRWLQTGFNFETAGVGVMRLVFVPEPGKLLLLVGGLSTLAILYRVRGR